MAGYAAAASLSQTGKLGTFGGANIPTVTAFMDGYARGAAYYNQAKGKKVAVLGWDTAKKDGTSSSAARPHSTICPAARRSPPT